MAEDADATQTLLNLPDALGASVFSAHSKVSIPLTS